MKYFDCLQKGCWSATTIAPPPLVGMKCGAEAPSGGALGVGTLSPFAQRASSRSTRASAPSIVRRSKTLHEIFVLNVHVAQKPRGMSRSVIASVIKSHGVGDEVEVRGADGGWYLTTVQWVGHMHREPGDAEDTERVTWLGVELVDSAAPSWPIAPGKSHNGYTHHAQYFTATKGRATFVRESEARNSAERSAAIAEAAAQPAITTFDIGMRVANIHGQGEQLGVVKFYGHLEGHIEADGDDDSDLSPDEKYVGVEYDKCVGSATAFLHHGVEIWEGARYHCELLHEADAREHLRTSKRPAAILVISSPTRGVGSVVDIAPESLASAGPAVSEAVASAQAELDLLCARASNMEARRLAEACFGEMDFDGNGTLSKKEFASAWFKGQVMDGPVLTDKFRRAGGDPGADTITKVSFLCTVTLYANLAHSLTRSP